MQAPDPQPDALHNSLNAPAKGELIRDGLGYWVSKNQINCLRVRPSFPYWFWNPPLCRRCNQDWRIATSIRYPPADFKIQVIVGGELLGRTGAASNQQNTRVFKFRLEVFVPIIYRWI